MATYGKKKKSLFSSFSVFQDEKDEGPRPRLSEKRSSEWPQIPFQVLFVNVLTNVLTI